MSSQGVLGTVKIYEIHCFINEVAGKNFQLEFKIEACSGL